MARGTGRPQTSTQQAFLPSFALPHQSDLRELLFPTPQHATFTLISLYNRSDFMSRVPYKKPSKYVVFQCPSCEQWLVAATIYASKKCTKCGKRWPLFKVVIQGRCDTSEASVLLIQHLKTGGVEPAIEFKQYKVKEKE